MEKQQKKKLFTLSLSKILLVLSFLFIISLLSLFFLTEKARKKEQLEYSKLFQDKDLCTPYDIVTEKDIKTNSIKVYWKTRSKCLGFINYGKYVDDLSVLAFPDNLDPKEVHFVSFSADLSATYYFVIMSDGIAYGENGSPIVFY